MIRIISLFLLLIVFCGTVTSQNINVLYTTDVHGAIFPYSFTEEKNVNNSLSQVYGYIKAVRDTSDNVIVLDNGDCLQGTPVNYFYNYINTKATNIIAQIYNYIGIDAVSVGNHDIEPGHEVYDKVRSELNMPWLAANAVDKKTGNPYFEPYKIIERSGKRIAVIGLITPYISHWLPEYKWEGIIFEDMVESARKWMSIVQEKEHPDAVIGLFHAGSDYNYGGQTADTYCNENASVLVAERVEGFNAILIGHDHKVLNKVVKSPNGRDVVVLDAGTAARNVGLLNIAFGTDGKVKCEAKLIAMANMPQSEEFNKKFEPHFYAVKAYTQRVIASVNNEIHAPEALFGNATIVDVAHKAMLNYSKADVSVSAPLLLTATLPVGNLTIGKMFSIYKFENTLNVIKLTGEELKRYLEYSYDIWLSDNPIENGHLLKVNGRGRLQNQFYNFDSAAGIVYTVNPFMPKGERVSIISMADGAKFDVQKTYTVAVNSYRSNGGGGHLERGVGLTQSQIAERIVQSIDRDLRSILMDYITNNATWSQPLNNWKFVADDSEALKKLIETDRKLFKLK